MTDSDDRILAGTRAAAEAVRAVNHAAYNATAGNIGALYDRVGSLHELLLNVEQAVRVLGDHVRAATDTPNLYSTDQLAPVEHLGAAAALLASAADGVHNVLDGVNNAWSHLSPVGRRLDHGQPQNGRQA